VEAGALPELNLAQLESQMSTDSANLITAQQTFEQNVLQLKAVLNIDAGAPFEVDTPPVEKIPLESIADLQPDVVYLLAMQNQPLQKVDSLKIKSAEKTLAANKALLYPRLSLSYSLQSNFSNTLKAQDLSKAVITGSTPTGDYVELNSNKYAVLTPTVSAPFESKSFSRWWDGYGSQLNNNFQQSVGISLSVPIFNNTNNYRINMEQSRLNLRNLQLQKEQDDITLKQNIYLAYTNAAAAMKKFNAGEKSVTYAQIAYDYARKRYEVGLLSTIDLLTTQNNLLKAKLQQLTNQYEYVFRMKLLEFYKGQGLKL
jgi:outer membrane protein